MIVSLDLTGYKPSPELLLGLINANELAIMRLTGRPEPWATEAIRTMEAEIARWQALLDERDGDGLHGTG